MPLVKVNPAVKHPSSSAHSPRTLTPSPQPLDPALHLQLHPYCSHPHPLLPIPPPWLPNSSTTPFSPLVQYACIMVWVNTCWTQGHRVGGLLSGTNYLSISAHVHTHRDTHSESPCRTNHPRGPSDSVLWLMVNQSNTAHQWKILLKRTANHCGPQKPYSISGQHSRHDGKTKCFTLTFLWTTIQTELKMSEFDDRLYFGPENWKLTLKHA